MAKQNNSLTTFAQLLQSHSEEISRLDNVTRLGIADILLSSPDLLAQKFYYQPISGKLGQSPRFEQFLQSTGKRDLIAEQNRRIESGLQAIEIQHCLNLLSKSEAGNVGIYKKDYEHWKKFTCLRVDGSKDPKYLIDWTTLRRGLSELGKSKDTLALRLEAISDELLETDEHVPPTILLEQYRVLRSIAVRRGQRQFREKLLNRYNRKCVITGCDAEEALEAAHIRPYAICRSFELENGLLLRSDIHVLFDLNLIAIDPETWTTQISDHLSNTTFEFLRNKSVDCELSTRPSAIYLRERYEDFLESKLQ